MRTARYLALMVLCTAHIAHAGDISVYGENPVVKRSMPIVQDAPAHVYDGRYELFDYSLMGNSDVKVYEYTSSKRAGVSHYRGDSAVIEKGTFRRNLLRLANDFNYGPIIWDQRTLNCVWAQETQYKLEGKEPKEILAYYAATQDFKLAFSKVDEHIQAIYTGPDSRLAPCQEGVGQLDVTRDQVVETSYTPFGMPTNIRVAPGP